ncbi:hypothetical protein BDW67DRAFT_169126 [Aspergillus spinulosporus]
METGFLALELNARSAFLVLCAPLVLAKRRRGAGLSGLVYSTVARRGVLPTRRVREKRPAVRRRGRCGIAIAILNDIDLKVVLGIVVTQRRLLSRY